MKKLFSKVFGRKEEFINEVPIHSYADFWDWFEKNEKAFYKVIKEQGNFEKDFFDHLAPKLNQIKEGVFYLCGMYATDTAELVLTAEADVKAIVFVEGLIAAAPLIAGWRFTALKPEYDIENCNINMDGLIFNKETLFFYPNELPEYPDEIDITIVHTNYNDDKNKANIIKGSYVFLDHYLGEIQSATIIDNITFVKYSEIKKELIPIEKLKSYLIWREKEFIEKHEHADIDIEDDFTIYEATLNDGSFAIAAINSGLLSWDAKASHPWFIVIDQIFDSENGMPADGIAKVLNDFEDNLQELLSPSKGNLYLGRETNKGVRKIYFACRDFRHASKVLYGIEKAYTTTKGFSYEIYKDKYWITLRKFMRSV